MIPFYIMNIVHLFIYFRFIFIMKGENKIDKYSKITIENRVDIQVGINGKSLPAIARKIGKNQ